MTKMPVLFIGHGSPMNAIENNIWTKNWRKLAKQIPQPQAILCISAHWMKEKTAITMQENPKTIYDFYGFPQELYVQNYPAKGNPHLAKEIQKKVQSVKIDSDTKWGLDHGTWSVLMHMYPQADIPVLQLSLQHTLREKECYDLGKELSFLREQGILILGSGNLVHNLLRMHPQEKAYSWAKEFDTFVKESLEKRDDKVLIKYKKHPTAQQAHPSPEHFLPLLYCLGATQKESVECFNEDLTFGSISMRSCLWK